MTPAPSRPSEPGRLIDLMWHPSTRVGRSGLTAAAIIDAAIALADAEGLDSLTMRAVAERAGVGAMTIYGYLSGRSELIELMVDRVMGSTYEGHPDPAGVGAWPEGLRHIAVRNWEHLLAHPWLTATPQGRPILGPGVCRKYEAELQALDGIGLDDETMDLTVTAIIAQVTQCARWRADLARTRSESGLSDPQWWALFGPRLEAAMTGEDLPVASRVSRSVASAGEPEAAWRFTLESLIDAIERRITG